MSTIDLLLAGGGGDRRPPIGSPLLGQFVITVPGIPRGPGRDLLFTAELDTIFRSHGRGITQRALQTYKAMGANHIVLGGIVGKGYSGQYDDTNWLDNPDYYCEYVEMIVGMGLEFTFFAFPDCAPYYDGSAHLFDWDRVKKDLVPFFKYPRFNRLVRRVCYMWEDWQEAAHMAIGYDILEDAFPRAERLWENGPGHLNPCMSYEPESLGWQVAKAHGITGMYMQFNAVDSTSALVPPVDGHSFTIDSPVEGVMEANCYDLLDMNRRFKDGYAGYPTGLTLDVGEGSAWGIDNANMDPNCGRLWWQTFSSFACVRNICDMMPGAQ